MIFKRNLSQSEGVEFKMTSENVRMNIWWDNYLVDVSKTFDNTEMLFLYEFQIKFHKTFIQSFEKSKLVLSASRMRFWIAIVF